MFTFYPYVSPFAAATPAPATVACPMPAAPPMPFFPYPAATAPAFFMPATAVHPALHHLPPVTTPTAATASSSSSPQQTPSVAGAVAPVPHQTTPFLLYHPQQAAPMACVMPSTQPVIFSASPPMEFMQQHLRHTTTTTTTTCSTTCSTTRRLPFIQPSPSTSPSTSPRNGNVPSVAAPAPAREEDGAASTSKAGTPAATTTVPVAILKATGASARGRSVCTVCNGTKCGNGSSGASRSPTGTEASLAALEISAPRKEQRDPAYAEKLERYRSKMRRIPAADPQRSLQASKRKRDSSGKFMKKEVDGRRTSARVEVPKPNEAGSTENGKEVAIEQGRKPSEEKEEKEEKSPRNKVYFLLN